MRWIHVTAACCALSIAATCLAETPDWSGNRPQATQLFQGGRLFGGQGWWNRYGEPVNSAALAQADASPNNGGPAPPMPAYGDGYIYSPGACDCPPPCIWHLWAGYFQNPKRCHQHQLFNHGGCGTCDDGCGNCCRPIRGTLAKVFCHGGCDSCSAPSCSTSASCGCATPTCSTPAADCGCKPVCCKCRPCHLANAWRCFAAHWSCGCDSCSSPVSCGCATPAPATVGPEKQASQGLPVPLPEEAMLFPLPRLN